MKINKAIKSYVVLITGMIFSTSNASIINKEDNSIIDRVNKIQNQIKSQTEEDEGINKNIKITQWGNWPNYWGDWNNWNNWPNWYNY